MTDVCWETCIGTSSISSSLGRKNEDCLSNCAARFVDSTLFITNRFAQLASKQKWKIPHKISFFCSVISIVCLYRNVWKIWKTSASVISVCFVRYRNSSAERRINCQLFDFKTNSSLILLFLSSVKTTANYIFFQITRHLLGKRLVDCKLWNP